MNENTMLDKYYQKFCELEPKISENLEMFLNEFLQFRLYLKTVDIQNITSFINISDEKKKLFKYLNNLFLIEYEIKTNQYILKLPVNELANIIENDYIFRDYNIKKEIFYFLFGYKNISTAIFVGCGSCPTATLAALKVQNTPNKLIAIDIDKNSLKRSKEFLTHFGNNSCEFICTFAEKYNFKMADFVYIPAFVEAKNEIIEQIFATVENDKIIVYVEQPDDLHTLFYSQFDINMWQNKGYKVEKVINSQTQQKFNHRFFSIEKKIY